MLDSWQVRHATVATTKEALSELARWQTDTLITVLVDYRLGGGIDGLDFAESILSRWPDRVFPILLTGETDETVLARARSKSIMVLSKPIKPIRLRAALTAVVQESGPTI
jgi:DNA-binding response OmpR family regulator